MKPSKTLKDLAAAAYTTAKEMIGKNQGEDLMPIFMALQPSDKIELIGTPFGDDRHKDMIAALLRKKFKEDYTKAYIHISEAWMVVQSKGDEPLTVQPSQSDRRKEVVIIVGQDRDGSFIHQIAEIQRDMNNKRSLGPLDKEFSKADKISGRFATLLD